jgi:hypothetical protein
VHQLLIDLYSSGQAVFSQYGDQKIRKELHRSIFNVAAINFWCDAFQKVYQATICMYCNCYCKLLVTEDWKGGGGVVEGEVPEFS